MGTITRSFANLITASGPSAVANGSITAADLASGVGGKVLQVVSTNKTDTFASTTNSTITYTDITGMSVSITPASASNKILVMCDVEIATGGSGLADIMRSLKIVKVISGTETNSSPIGDTFSSETRATASNIRSIHDLNGINRINIHYLDSPNTTSAITYKLQFLSTGGQGGSIFVNRTTGTPNGYGVGASTITVMEVKG